MKHLFITLSAMCITFASTSFASDKDNSGGLESLRGAAPISTQQAAESLKRREKDNASNIYRRAHQDNPPMIPHESTRYWITPYDNKCLDCHEKRIAKRKRATPLPDSHYTDRSGKTYEKAAKRRYFCRQCHAEQVDAKPLVANEY